MRRRSIPGGLALLTLVLGCHREVEMIPLAERTIYTTDRFYDVQAGSIELDGVDVRRLRLHDLRRAVAIVFEDTFLFHESHRALVERSAALAPACHAYPVPRRPMALQAAFRRWRRPARRH